MNDNLPLFWCFSRMHHEHLIVRKDIQWCGPYSWPEYEHRSALDPLPDMPGVYVVAFDYGDSYIIRTVGVTTSMRRRFREHTRAYQNGLYSVLEIESAKSGVRQELWHGWGHAKEHRDQFHSSKSMILEHVNEELSASRIFVTHLDEKRMRERLEAAILMCAYTSKEPWADLIDGGMHMRGRFNYEVPIEVRNLAPHRIYGLPTIIEV